uniref:Uncharacterized protein n=1 Tax=Desertifilum tharense IPPAS B-1220 TaxID=1781255 RepID=A0A1E5QCW1_9CYAN|nr:hypothetical protein BH720_24635 [Desertifilum tharense IPPAS B-1220]
MGKKGVGEEGSWELGVRSWGKKRMGGWGEEGSWELGVRSWGLGNKRQENSIIINSALFSPDPHSEHRCAEASYGTRNFALFSPDPHSELGTPLRGSKLRNFALDLLHES